MHARSRALRSGWERCRQAAVLAAAARRPRASPPVGDPPGPLSFAYAHTRGGAHLRLATEWHTIKEGIMHASMARELSMVTSSRQAAAI